MKISIVSIIWLIITIHSYYLGKANGYVEGRLEEKFRRRK